MLPPRPTLQSSEPASRLLLHWWFSVPGVILRSSSCSSRMLASFGKPKEAAPGALLFLSWITGHLSLGPVGFRWFPW